MASVNRLWWRVLAAVLPVVVSIMYYYWQAAKIDVVDGRYVAMIDAGSAGSRIHVFHFDHQSSRPSVLNETFDYTIPGLSSYVEDPEMAAESLKPLLDRALEVIPKECHSCTSISVMATAGLRLLGDAEAQAILDAVKKKLQNYPLQIRGVELLDGKDEGVFAWATVNYLLGNLERHSNNTAAVFDLGGASAQIVFEPNLSVYTFQEAEQVLSQAHDHRYDFKFGTNYHTLYQHSHLGYGLMEARKQVHRLVVEEAKDKSFYWNELKVQNGEQIINPCIATGSKRTVNIDIDGRKNYVKVDMVGPAAGGGSKECLRLTHQLLNKNKTVTGGNKLLQSGFNGVPQPSLADTFAGEQLYIVSYFYDRIFPLGAPLSFPLSQLRDMTDKVCQGRSSWEREYYSAFDQLEERPEWCLDLSYMFTLLHEGYGIPLDRQVTIGKQMDGYGLSWCLGSALQLLRMPLEYSEEV